MTCWFYCRKVLEKLAPDSFPPFLQQGHLSAAPYCSGVDEDAAELAVEHHPAVFLHAAPVPEQVQDAGSDLRRQGLVEVLLGRHEVEQPLAGLAARVEAVSDVEVVGDGQLLVPEAQALGTGHDFTWGAILGDGMHTQLLLEGLPQVVPATFF